MWPFKRKPPPPPVVQLPLSERYDLFLKDWGLSFGFANGQRITISEIVQEMERRVREGLY